MSHTPGPWKVGYGQNGVYPRGIEAMNNIAGGIRNIVRWNGIAFPSSSEGQANARLIAAAPDLLAVCKRVVQQADELAQSVGLERIIEAEGSCIEQARIAIAKAEGAETAAMGTEK